MIVRARDRDDERTGPDQDRGPHCARALPCWRRAVALGLALVALVGCGAKTGPRVPCEIALERRPPPILLMLEHSSGMVEGDPGRPNYWATTLATFDRLVVALEDLAPLGALPFPYPERRWDLGSSAPQCVADSGFLVAPRSHNGAPVRAAVDEIGEPAAGSPVYDAIGLAATALHDAPDASSRGGIIVYVTGGGINCNLTFTRATCVCPSIFPIDFCIDRNGEGANCIDRARVVTRLETLRSEGITMVVLGVDTHLSSSYLPVQVANLEAMAAAGGHARPGGASPAYYRAADPDDVEAVLNDVLAPELYCALRGELGGHDPARMTLREGGGATIARDPTRRDGWDWTDIARGELEIFGPTCRRFAAARGVAFLVTVDSVCQP